MSTEVSKESEKKEEESKVEEDKEKVAEPVVQTVEDEILAHLVMIGRAVSTTEPRFTLRILRTLTTLRKKLTKPVLRFALDQAFPKGSKTGQTLIASSIFQDLPSKDGAESMEIDADASPVSKKYSPPTDSATGDLLPEGVVYLRLLLILANLDAGKSKEAGEFALETTELITQANRRTLDQLAAKVYFYLARAYELQGRLTELQPLLLATRQTASLRKDETLEATVLNLLIRSYLAQHQYDQADRLVARVTFPTNVNQAQSVRYMFYLARLRAVQLNYASASTLLNNAIRRAPKDEVAPGFVQILHKYLIVVTLLTGVIPDRAIFRKPVLKQALVPYFQIVQAVRVGDMTAFQKAFSTYESTFNADSTHFLILRLRHFVIKTALRSITLAYSRISLADVCVKLHLDSEEDTEYIVAKAIKDGVIDATIDHAGGYMQSRIAKDVYETDAPQLEFNRRVGTCTQLYNETVRAMRYPPNAHRRELESAADARERDREYAQLVQESEDAGDDLDDL